MNKQKLKINFEQELILINNTPYYLNYIYRLLQRVLKIKKNC